MYEVKLLSGHIAVVPSFLLQTYIQTNKENIFGYNYVNDNAKAIAKKKQGLCSRGRVGRFN